MSLYHTTLPQLTKMLTNLEGWLTKAEAFCAERDIPLESLLAQRLYPNMYDLRMQVQHACSNATLLADRLGGKPRPGVTYDDELTFADVRQLVADSKAFIASIDAEQVAGAEDRMVAIPLIDGMQIRGEDMATDFSMANVYFHLTTAYGIMRQLGVPIGKSDFLGPMALVPAA